MIFYYGSPSKQILELFALILNKEWNTAETRSTYDSEKGLYMLFIMYIIIGNTGAWGRQWSELEGLPTNTKLLVLFILNNILYQHTFWCCLIICTIFKFEPHPISKMGTHLIKIVVRIKWDISDQTLADQFLQHILDASQSQFWDESNTIKALLCYGLAPAAEQYMNEAE